MQCCESGLCPGLLPVVSLATSEAELACIHHVTRLVTDTQNWLVIENADLKIAKWTLQAALSHIRC